MFESKIIELILNLGVAATVVAMAFYMFMRIFNKLVDDNREDNRTMLETHQKERQEWREHQERANKEFTNSLRDHTKATVDALQKVIAEVQIHGFKNYDQSYKKTNN